MPAFQGTRTAVVSRYEARPPKVRRIFGKFVPDVKYGSSLELPLAMK
jgi:hypothetical protein